MSVRIDLHTHSVASPDGSTTLDEYADLLKSGSIDYVAITDHDRTDFALNAQAQLGERIIIGEEITTSEGEIIGLFLRRRITPGQSAIETCKDIKKQGGLVYVPHPFETVRKGINIEVLDSIANLVDIIEAPNGRSLQPHDEQALNWAKRHKKAICGSSDAHRSHAVARTHTLLNSALTKNSLVKLLSDASVVYKRPSLLDLLAPKFNRYIRSSSWLKGNA